jgi:hypothetical protein
VGTDHCQAVPAAVHRAADAGSADAVLGSVEGVAQE